MPCDSTLAQGRLPKSATSWKPEAGAFAGAKGGFERHRHPTSPSVRRGGGAAHGDTEPWAFGPLWLRWRARGFAQGYRRSRFQRS